MHLFDHLHTVNTHRRLGRHYCWKPGLVWPGLQNIDTLAANFFAAPLSVANWVSDDAYDAVCHSRWWPAT